ncbi:MAG TPA: hypothetical protein VGF08_10230 [Terriglobales bacterium]|jgi:hypothetical protein
MYTGTLIEDLFATVERAESRVRIQQEPAELEASFPAETYQLAMPEAAWLGVA